MSEKRFIYEEEPYHFPIKKRIRDTQNNETYIYDLRECCDVLNEQQVTIHSLKEEVRLLKPTNIEQYEQIVQLQEENEQLRNRLTFLNKVISFFADNPMTKYSSKSELLEEMRLLEKMGLI